MVDNRIVELGGIWANGAIDPPANPVAETTYADSGLSQSEIEEAWPYRKVVDSAIFNEFMRRVSVLTQALATYGVMPWCATTDYEIGSRILGSNGGFYRCILVPCVNRNPISSPTYWVDDFSLEAAARVAGDAAEASARGAADTAHAALTSPHGATSSATASRLALRNSNGELGVAIATGANNATPLRQFGLEGVASNGRMLIPSYGGNDNQMFIQYGEVTVPGESTVSITWYRTFPTAIRQAIVCLGDSASSTTTGSLSISNLSVSGAVIRNNYAGSHIARYFAIGY